jgi:hypothetical protein
MELVQVCHHKYQEYNDDPTKNLKLQLLNFNYHRRAAALMPSIAVVRGTTIAIYYNDHDPPHFHAIRGGVEFRVRIADLTIFPSEGGAPAIERDVLAWAAEWQAELALGWVRARSAQLPGRIS